MDNNSNSNEIGVKILMLVGMKLFFIGAILVGCVQRGIKNSDANFLEKAPNEYIQVFTITGNFEQGSITLTTYGKNLIDKVGEYLSQNSYEQVVIEGHTDSIGQSEYNQILSERRSQQVKNYLVRKWKVEPSKVKTMGFGSTDPLYDNSTQEGRGRNRRVMVKIKSKP